MTFKVDTYQSYNNLMTCYAYNCNDDIINTTSELYQLIDFITILSIALMKKLLL